jgi:arylsulfatase A-like enzyme
MRFIDDAVADAIARLDPTKNLIIFTGDHGESIYDDGHYTHGYSFAEVLTKTPFAMVGPGVSPQRLSQTTSHIDVLPSVLHALTGQRQHVEHVQGVDWFAGEQHASLLAAHSPSNKQVVQALLKVEGRRLRLDLDLTRPSITLLGFEDELAHFLPVPELTALDVTTIAHAFDEQLSLLRQ